MQRLPVDLFRAALEGQTLLVSSQQRATAMQLAYAARQIADGANSWATPGVVPLRAWLRRRVARAAERGADVPRPLHAAEEWLLWREAIDQLPASAALLDRGGLQRELQRAATTLTDYGLDPAALAREPGDEPRWLHATIGHVERRAAALGAICAHQVAAVASRLPLRQPVMLVGQLQLGPAIRNHLASIPSRNSSDTTALVLPRVVRPLDAADELAAMASDCAALLRSRPAARVLLVVPRLPERRAALTRCLRESLCPANAMTGGSDAPWFAFEGGVALHDYAFVEQTLDALQWLTGALPVSRLLRLLNSPFWGSGDATTRAQLSWRLQASIGDETGAADLMRWLSTARNAPVAQDAAFAVRIAAALRVLEGRSLSPRGWSERFAKALLTLGFALPVKHAEEAQLQARWHELLGEAGNTDSIATQRSVGDSLQVVRQLAGSTVFAPASGDTFVTVTESLADPVLYYDAIWVAGLSDDVWPQAVRPDPFIPWIWQRQANVPGASAENTLRSAESAVGAWRNCASVLTFSAAAQDANGAMDLSPALAKFPVGATPILVNSVALAGRQAFAALENYADDVGTPWVKARPIPGGTRSLDLQNRCAFLAYTEQRLGAPRPEFSIPGIDKRTRGVFVHECLQQFWEGLRAEGGAKRQVLAAMAADQRRARIAAAMRLARTQRAAGPHWDRELQRTQQLLERFLTVECTRGDFSVVQMEWALDLQLAGATLQLKLDRVDELPGGQWAVIDYKTGRKSDDDWEGERMTHLQLLAYAGAIEQSADASGRVAALAIAHLTPQSPAYSGRAMTAGEWPGVKPPALPWDQQWSAWQATLSRVVEEFLAGDARLTPIDASLCARCHATMFCRRTERLGAT